MTMATPSLIATTFATRAGTRILMRAGDDDGVRSLRRRRRRGGVATAAQRSAVRHSTIGGVRCLGHRTHIAALRRMSAGALSFVVGRDEAASSRGT